MGSEKTEGGQTSRRLESLYFDNLAHDIWDEAREETVDIYIPLPTIKEPKLT